MCGVWGRGHVFCVGGGQRGSGVGGQGKGGGTAFVDIKGVGTGGRSRLVSAAWSAAQEGNSLSGVVEQHMSSSLSTRYQLVLKLELVCCSTSPNKLLPSLAAGQAALTSLHLLRGRPVSSSTHSAQPCVTDWTTNTENTRC